MKLGQKRIKNDNFEIVEKCSDCGKLFWMKADGYDDFYSKCRKCLKIEEDKENEVFENAKKNGKEIKNKKGDVVGWTYKGYFYNNPNYFIDFSDECIIENIKINILNIDDFIREKRKNGFKKLYWTEQALDILRNFVIANGYGDINFFGKNGGMYMGVRHYLEK
jgi:DNA-directed RNA polymerase subunit M/transcription elongation factor TFIIS